MDRRRLMLVPEIENVQLQGKHQERGVAGLPWWWKVAAEEQQTNSWWWREVTQEPENAPADDCPNWRFWACFLLVSGVLAQSGFVGGFTSPVLSTNCGGNSGGIGSDGDASSGSDAGARDYGEGPCPRCLNCELELSVQVQSVFTAEVSVFGSLSALIGGGLADKLGRRTALGLFATTSSSPTFLRLLLLPQTS